MYISLYHDVRVKKLLNDDYVNTYRVTFATTRRNPKKDETFVE